MTALVNESTLRTLVEIGSVKKLQVVAHGGRFHVAVATANGSVIATTKKGGVKTWVSLDAAARWVHALGVGSFVVEIERWQPRQSVLRTPRTSHNFNE